MRFGTMTERRWLVDARSVSKKKARQTDACDAAENREKVGKPASEKCKYH